MSKLFKCNIYYFKPDTEKHWTNLKPEDIHREVFYLDDEKGATFDTMLAKSDYERFCVLQKEVADSASLVRYEDTMGIIHFNCTYLPSKYTFSGESGLIEEGKITEETFLEGQTCNRSWKDFETNWVDKDIVFDLSQNDVHDIVEEYSEPIEDVYGELSLFPVYIDTTSLNGASYSSITDTHEAIFVNFNYIGNTTRSEVKDFLVRGATAQDDTVKSEISFAYQNNDYQTRLYRNYNQYTQIVLSYCQFKEPSSPLHISNSFAYSALEDGIKFYYKSLFGYILEDSIIVNNADYHSYKNQDTTFYSPITINKSDIGQETLGYHFGASYFYYGIKYLLKFNYLKSNKDLKDTTIQAPTYKVDPTDLQISTVQGNSTVISIGCVKPLQIFCEDENYEVVTDSNNEFIFKFTEGSGAENAIPLTLFDDYEILNNVINSMDGNSEIIFNLLYKENGTLRIDVHYTSDRDSAIVIAKRWRNGTWTEGLSQYTKLARTVLSIKRGDSFTPDIYNNLLNGLNEPDKIPTYCRALSFDKEYDDVKDQTFGVIHLYGIYIESYSVDFYGGVGEGQKKLSDTQYVEFGLPADEPADKAVPIGFEFDKWDTNDWQSVIADTIVNAVYKKKVLTVRFYDIDKNVFKTENVEYGEFPSETTAPEVENYVFDYWGNKNGKNTGIIVITKNTDFYAYYKTTDITVIVHEVDNADGAREIAWATLNNLPISEYSTNYNTGKTYTYHYSDWSNSGNTYYQEIKNECIYRLGHNDDLSRYFFLIGEDKVFDKKYNEIKDVETGSTIELYCQYRKNVYLYFYHSNVLENAKSIAKDFEDKSFSPEKDDEKYELRNDYFEICDVSWKEDIETVYDAVAVAVYNNFTSLSYMTQYLYLNENDIFDKHVNEIINISKEDDDVILYTKYRLKGYEIKFVGYCDEVISSVVVEVGKDTTPPVLVSDDFEFIKWDSEKYKNVQENATITAIGMPKWGYLSGLCTESDIEEAFECANSNKVLSTDRIEEITNKVLSICAGTYLDINPEVGTDSGMTPFNPEGGATNDEAAANSIINVKNMEIIFKPKDFPEETRKYVEEKAMPYITMMIPSTTIFRYSFSGDTDDEILLEPKIAWYISGEETGVTTMEFDGIIDDVISKHIEIECKPNKYRVVSHNMNELPSWLSVTLSDNGMGFDVEPVEANDTGVDRSFDINIVIETLENKDYDGTDSTTISVTVTQTKI